MKALREIIRRVVENPSHAWALATFVETEGSTYRKPGARLLIDSDGGTLVFLVPEGDKIVSLEIRS